MDTVSKDGEIKVNGSRGQSGSILLFCASSYEGRSYCTVMCGPLWYILAGTYSRCLLTATSALPPATAVTITTVVLTTLSYHSPGGRSVAIPQESC